MAYEQAALTKLEAEFIESSEEDHVPSTNVSKKRWAAVVGVVVVLAIVGVVGNGRWSSPVRPAVGVVDVSNHAIVADAEGSADDVYVFLNKFPLKKKKKGTTLYHTEVVVCPKAGFSDSEQEDLDSKIAAMTDFAEIENWDNMAVSCVHLSFGHGGKPICDEKCCGIIKKNVNLNEADAVISQADNSQRTVFVYGTGSFDGNVAYDNMCGETKCWSNWAGSDYSKETNNCNVFSSAVLSMVYGLSQEKPDLGPSQVTEVDGHCPASRRLLETAKVVV